MCSAYSKECFRLSSSNFPPLQISVETATQWIVKVFQMSNFKKKKIKATFTCINCSLSPPCHCTLYLYQWSMAMSFALLGLEPHILLTILVSLIVFLWRKHLGLPSDSVSPQGCPEPCRGTDGPILNLPCSLLWKSWLRKTTPCSWVTSKDRRQLDPQQLWTLGAKGVSSIEVHHDDFYCENMIFTGTEWILGSVAFTLVVWPWTVKTL